MLAAQAFGFAAGGHVTGRLIGARLETKQEEEFRAGSHGLVMWAITVAAGLVLLALVAAGGAAMHRDAERSESSISAYWADMLLHPDSAARHGARRRHRPGQGGSRAHAGGRPASRQHRA